MFKNLLLAVGTTLTLLSTPVAAATQMENGVWFDAFRWQSGGTGRLTILFHTANDNGKIQVCGSYFMSGPLKTKKLSRQAIDSYRIRIGTRTLVNNVTFMASVRYEEDLGRARECLTTNVDWFDGANDQLSGQMTRF